MESCLIHEAVEAQQCRRPVILLTELSSGRQRLISPGDEVTGALGEEIGRRFAAGQSGSVEIGDERFFLEVRLPSPKLLIVGAVHIAQALAPMAQLAEFEVTIVDPRPAFATSERFSVGQKVVCDWPEDWLPENPLDAWSALACFTHEPNIDDQAIAHALDRDCFYIGALGGKKSQSKRLERLASRGLEPNKLARISGPIGLDIGSTTPAEIAVATLAEIISALRKR
ncbi:MAG: XdhC family protein [Pseudomonadota bacterium]